MDTHKCIAVHRATGGADATDAWRCIDTERQCWCRCELLSVQGDTDSSVAFRAKKGGYETNEWLRGCGKRRRNVLYVSGHRKCDLVTCTTAQIDSSHDNRGVSHQRAGRWEQI